RLQLRRGDRGDGGVGRERLAAWSRFRMDRHVVSGKAGREASLLCIRDGTAVDVSGAGRPIRELVPAVCGAAGRSPFFARTRPRTNGLGVANNLYTQVGLVLLLALSAKNAILIVEVARERRLYDGKLLLAAAVEAARTRFRPIPMTSFAFILGVLPLVLARGAGASARKSIGLAVFSGMIPSTCLAVLFVPSFFVVIQRCEEWWSARKGTETGKAGDGDGRSFA